MTWIQTHVGNFMYSLNATEDDYKILVDGKNKLKNNVTRQEGWNKRARQAMLTVYVAPDGHVL